MDILHEYNGLPGLFIACIYSAAISTLSSGLNSLAAVILHDFIYPFHSNLSEAFSIRLSKILVVLFGLFTIGLSFLCSYLSSTVLQISLSIFGLLGGPLLGVISLGMFVPFSNSKAINFIFK
jgi:sodium-dependent multivitamin transporter 6